MQPEGEIYHRLHENNVPNIPPCLLSGDVDNNDTHHTSQTHEIVNEHFTYNSHWNITPYRHYRMVLGVVGRRLEKFNRTWEVVNAMHAALKAHEAAYNAGVLHQDISTGNILIVGPTELADHDDQSKPKIDGGMLIDWDLSKIVDGSTTCQYAQTGTWPFMAADLVKSSRTPQTYVHDLESFFWVLLWIVLRLVETSWDSGRRSCFLDMAFNPKVYICPEDGAFGGIYKTMFLANPAGLGDLQIPNNPSLQGLLRRLHMLLGVRHRGPPSMHDPILADGSPLQDKDIYDMKLAEHNRQLGYLKDHQMILRLFAKILGPSYNWPADDKAVPQEVVPSIN